MLHVEYFGDKNKTPLVLLHGFLGTVKDLYPLINHLKQRFFCIAFDLPGHGLSEFVTDLSFSTFPILLKQELLKLNITKFHMLGYSLGGRLALCFDEKFPNCCQKLILIGAHLGLNSAREKDQRNIRDKAWAELLEKEGLHKFLTKWYLQPIFTTLCSSSEKLKIMIKKRSDQNIKALIHYLKHLSLSKQKNYTNHLLSSPSRFALFSGRKDTKFSKLYDDLKYLKITRSKIDEASHAPHLEQPESLASLVLKHLTNEDLL